MGKGGGWGPSGRAIQDAKDNDEGGERSGLGHEGPAPHSHILTHSQLTNIHSCSLTLTYSPSLTNTTPPAVLRPSGSKVSGVGGYTRSPAPLPGPLDSGQRRARLQGGGRDPRQTPPQGPTPLGNPDALTGAQGGLPHSSPHSLLVLQVRLP